MSTTHALSQCGFPFFESLNCLSVEKYAGMVDMLRMENPRLDTIIVTSEERPYVANFTRLMERRRNPALNAEGLPVWRLVFNSVDVMQGAGDPGVLFKGYSSMSDEHWNGNNHGVDEVFMSFYSTFLLLMRARYFVINCGSNYHTLLR